MSVSSSAGVSGNLFQLSARPSLVTNGHQTAGSFPAPSAVPSMSKAADQLSSVLDYAEVSLLASIAVLILEAI